MKKKDGRETGRSISKNAVGNGECDRKLWLARSRAVCKYFTYLASLIVLIDLAPPHNHAPNPTKY